MSQRQSYETPFDVSLVPLRRRAIWVSGLVALAAACLVVLCSLVISAWVDLTVPLPAGIRRWMLPLSLFSGAIAGYAWWYRQRSNRRDAELVRQVDQAGEARGEVMAGYDLETSSAEDAPEGGLRAQAADRFTASLSAMARDHAQTKCEDAKPADVLPNDAARRWWRLLGIVVGVLLLFAIVMPSLSMTQAGRILLPSDSQLPYSPTTIRVEPGDTEVLFGENLEVLASTEGPALSQVELVLAFDDGTVESLPMLDDGEERFRTYLTRITESADYHVAGEGTRSRSHRLEVRMTPQFGDINCRVTPPAYTNQSPSIGLIPRNGVEGLAGTSVALQIESNRPLATSRLSVFWDGGKEEQVDLQPIQTPEEPSGIDDALGAFAKYDVEPGNVVVGEFEIVDSGRFEIHLKDVDGISSSQPYEGEIRVLKDRSPVVRLLEPKPISLATPDVALPIVVAAEDDFGLSSIRLYRGLNQSPPTAVDLAFDLSSPQARAKTRLPLSEYGLQPGDEITLFARVEDNDPSGAKGAESEIATVRIISREQLAKMQLQRRGAEALVSKQRRVQRLIDSLREELEQAAEEGQSGEQESGQEDSKPGQRNSNLAESLRDARKAAKEAADGMREMSRQELPVDVDREMNEWLKEMAKEMDEVAKRLEELQKKAGSPGGLSEEDKKELQELMDQVQKQRDKHDQQMMQPTSDLSKILPLAMDQQKFVALVTRQRSLATRMNALQEEAADSPDVARRTEQLRKEQQQLQISLDELLDEIESHVNALPNDPDLDELIETATKFVQEVRQSQADEEMLETQMRLLDDRFPEAASHCDKAAEILESFVSQCNSMGQKACKNCKAKFNPSNGCPNPGNSISQLLSQMGMGQGTPGSQPGMGPGNAPGGGYSMRQATRENIGVYGGLPMQQSQPRRGKSDSDQSGGVASYRTGGKNDGGDGSSQDTASVGASGDGVGSIPTRYRGTVSDYFRTIAEELGEQE
ncbi:MAG: hypothetical protein AAFU85_25250 [Planctomycetota bacterium]